MAVDCHLPADDGTLRRERRKLRTRRALCKAAVALFEENGYAGTSASAIANAADYAERTFFRHFTRKEDVVFYDLPERLASMRAAFAAGAEGGAWEVVRRTLIENAGTWETVDRDLTLARVRLFHTEPALEARYLEFCLEWEDAVAAIMAAELGGDPASDLRCRLLAAAVVGGFRAAFRAWLADPASGLVVHLERAYDLLESDLRP